MPDPLKPAATQLTSAVHDLYVYYRVAEENAAALAPKVCAMQQQLVATLGVVGKLKRRPHAAEGVQTWMEVYLATSAGFDSALQAAVHGAELASLIDGERHIEVFIDLSACA